MDLFWIQNIKFDSYLNILFTQPNSHVILIFGNKCLSSYIIESKSMKKWQVENAKFFL